MIELNADESHFLIQILSEFSINRRGLADSLFETDGDIDAYARHMRAAILAEELSARALLSLGA